MGSTDTGALDGAAQNLQSTKTDAAKPSPGGSGLTGPVGIGGLNAPDDVWRVSSALTDNGLMAAPQTGADNTLDKGIIGAQERMDGTLKRDGLVNPGGPTERTFARLAGQGFVKGATADPDTVYATAPERTPPPGRLPEGSSAQALARRRQRARAEADARERQQRINEMERARAERTRLRAAKAALGRDPGPRSAPAARPPAAAGRLATSLGRLAGNALAEVVETATGGGTGAATAAQDGNARSGRGGTVPSRPAPLTAAQAAANRRTADALGKYTGVGDLPTFTADAIDTDPARAVPEVADLIGQVRRRDPDQARELYERTVSRIDAESRRRLDAMLSRDAATPDPNGPRELDLGLAVPNGDSVETRSITVPPVRVRQPQKEEVPEDPGQNDPDEPTVPEDPQPDAPDPEGPEAPSDPSDPEAPSEPSEPEEPDEPDEANKRKCERLRLQLEVDGNNLDAARNRFDEANKRVEELVSQLDLVREGKSKAVWKTRGASIGFLTKPGPSGAAGLVEPLVDYGGKEIDFQALADMHREAVAERDLRLQDVEEAGAEFGNTLDKLAANGCD